MKIYQYKKLFLIFGIVFACLVVTAQKRFQFGGGGQAIFDEFNLGVQVKAKFDVHEDWGTASTFTFYLDDFVNWGVDIDVHRNDLLVIGRTFSISPITGLNILRTDADTPVGLNLGLFTDFPIKNNVRVYVEPKYIIGNANGLVISAGVSF